MIRQTYRLCAAACAELVWRVPALEPAFVGVGARAWRAPGVGRFYRSAAYRLVERLRTIDARFRSVVVGDQPLVLDVTEFTTTPLYFGGAVYEPATTEVLIRRLRPGHVFVDVGANHGYFTLLAASLVGPTGRVAAFEPNPRVFTQLRTHVRLNRFDDRVTLEPYALADRPATGVPLFVSQVETNSGLSSLAPGAAALSNHDLSASATVPVTVETFDRWLAGRPPLTTPRTIDLVKIDVEGAESRVIAGMTESLTNGRIRALIVETIWQGETHRQLCERGYRGEALDRGGELTNILFTWTGHASRG